MGCRKFLDSLRQNRLAQFLLAGGLIFALAPAPRSSTAIRLEAPYLDAVRAAQAQKLGVAALSPSQRAEVDARAAEDEVLYREALRLGLDRADPVIRQHLIQKMLLVAEDLGGASQPPTEAELRDYFARTREHWQAPATLAGTFVFAADAERARALRPRAMALDASGDARGLMELGDPLPQSRDFSGTAAQLEAAYGPRFAAALEALPAGQWSEPIPSKLGWHLVKLQARAPARLQTFEEARGLLQLEYVVARRQRAVSRFVESAFARYQVDVGGVPYRAHQATGRVGVRGAPSGED